MAATFLGAGIDSSMRGFARRVAANLTEPSHG
jgi:hypothetical protein